MGARRYTVTGRVQGVGFRWFVLHQARSLGLTGWVRNEMDGSVRVWAEGSDEALDALSKLLSQGPPGSRVRSLNHDAVGPTDRYDGFDVLFR